MIDVLGGTVWDGVRFHHAAQNGVQCKTYESFISGVLHVIFLHRSSPQVTKSTDSETVDKERREPLCILVKFLSP